MVPCRNDGRSGSSSSSSSFKFSLADEGCVAGTKSCLISFPTLVKDVDLEPERDDGVSEAGIDATSPPNFFSTLALVAFPSRGALLWVARGMKVKTELNRSNVIAKR